DQHRDRATGAHRRDHREGVGRTRGARGRGGAGDLSRLLFLLHQDHLEHPARGGAARGDGRRRGAGRLAAHRAREGLQRPGQDRSPRGPPVRVGDRGGDPVPRDLDDPPEGPGQAQQPRAVPPGPAADAGDLPRHREQRRAVRQGRVARAGPGAERLHGPPALPGQGRAAAPQGDRDDRAGRGHRRARRVDPTRREL
ncbi:MAG: Propanediol dehydratase medium subunit, partial [uncultured Actinomycetospora sp.]